jgi:hypothetical protein
MDPFTHDDLRDLLHDRGGPRVSFLMRTTRGGQHQDRTDWKSHLQRAEEWLRARGQRGPDVHDLLGPARDLLDDAQFWLNVSDGLAGFMAPGFFRTYRVPRPLPEMVVTGSQFYLKPLVPLLKPRESREQMAGLYRQLHGTGRTANDVHEIVPAAHGGHIECVFTDGRQDQWGRFDPVTGHVDVHEREEPDDEELLNLAVVFTLAHGGAAYVVDTAEMPDAAPLAAIYRLPIGDRSDAHALPGAMRI